MERMRSPPIDGSAAEVVSRSFVLAFDFAKRCSLKCAGLPWHPPRMSGMVAAYAFNLRKVLGALIGNEQVHLIPGLGRKTSKGISNLRFRSHF